MLFRSLERPLHDDEVRAINERISRLGAERLEEVVLDRVLNLTVWLADPNAR